MGHLVLRRRRLAVERTADQLVNLEEFLFAVPAETNRWSLLFTHQTLPEDATGEGAMPIGT